MSYVTTGSSNTVIPGNSIHLNIRISKEALAPIFLTGNFIIEGLMGIAKEEDLEDMTCTVYGQMADDDSQATTPIWIGELEYSDTNADRRFTDIGYNKDEFTYIDIKLEGSIATMTTPTTRLRISFEDQNNTDHQKHTIDFEVHIEQEKLEILSFTADPLILQGNRDNQVTLKWKIEGGSYTYRILKGLTELNAGNGNGKETGNHKTIPSNGDHVYTLEVTQGETIITKDVKVRVLRDSTLDWLDIDDFIIGNFCASQDSNFLFGLMLIKEDNKHAKIDHIGYTPQGFSEKWKSIGLSNEDKEALKPYANSPMIHIKHHKKGGYGRLLFIGGSYVKPMQCAKKVAIVDLDGKEKDKVHITPDHDWESRMGHSCVLFPHGDKDKIWLLGGVDKYGNALNDVWVTENGTSWDNINKKGIVQTKDTPVAMDWDARCMAGITVLLDHKGAKKSLWFGGGFSEIGGDETGDIWRFENNNWTRVHQRKNSPFSINSDSYLSSGLAFTGRDDKASTGIALLGGHIVDDIKTYFFNKITLQNSGFYGAKKIGETKMSESFATNNDAYVVTSYFKGSLWFMVFTDEGDDGITYSDLYYWIPKKGKETLILL